MKNAKRISRVLMPVLAGLIFGGIQVCIPLNGAGIAGARSGRMKSLFITYKRPLAPPGAISQVITSTHGCLLTVTGPFIGVDLPDRQEIGRYRRPCEEREFELLQDLAAAAANEVLVEKKETLPRGTRFLTFGTGEAGKDLEVLSSAPLSKEFPPAVRRFDDAMIASAKKSLDHPFTVLKGLASAPSTLSSLKDDLKLEVVFRNAGVSPISFVNPAAKEDEESMIAVQIEKNVPPAQLEDKDQVSVRINKGEISLLRFPGAESGQKAGQIIRLDPRQEAVFSVQVTRKLFMGKGSYRAWVTYQSQGQGMPEEEAVVGLIRTYAGVFAVTGKK